MRTAFWAIVALGTMAALIVSCKNDNGTGPVTAGEGVVSGIVSDGQTNNPLAGVSVTANSLTGQAAKTTTGTDGKFSVTFTIDSTSSVIITFSISGWRDTTLVYPLRSGTITPATVVMTRKSVISGGTGGSGVAQTIAFLGAQPQQLSVKGVGGLETSLLSFEVRDSLGLPIDASHAVPLTVTVQNGPGGGEYVSPSPITTNASGQAFTTLNAGIRSGVVQIVAMAPQVAGGANVISTAPIRIIISGGFPDQAHFTIATQYYNLPILDIAGARTTISVLVGDKYSNPVAANTAVYFRSSAGVIQSRVFTNEDGQGSVDLISGNPQPIGAPYAAAIGDGYHYVVARTLGQNSVVVTDSILVLWSGQARPPVISPTSFDIGNGRDTVFTITVVDRLGHPLAKGTTISVSATVPPPSDPNAAVNQVQVAFGLSGSITLNDYMTPGVGTTVFTCRVSDGTTNIIDPIGTAVTMTVFVNGPNGQAATTISGLVH